MKRAKLDENKNLLNWEGQGNFISEMEWVPFKEPFLDGNESIVQLMVSTTSGFLCDTDLVIKICQIMTTTRNDKN